jgi:hypothetical protein
MNTREARALAAGALLAAAVASRAASGADHLDPSPRLGGVAGDAADIADLYAWHTGARGAGGNLVVALDFGGPQRSLAFAGDRDVLYAIHLDGADADLLPDLTIHARFGQSPAGEWGVEVEGLPGVDGRVVGRVGAVIDLGGAMVFAGVRDDPFFFDLQGFRETLMTGDVAFSAARDFFAGQNVSTLVVELPLRALPEAGPYRVWATTARFR